MAQQTMTSIQVFDRSVNTFYPVQGQDTLIDVVRFNICVPYRGDTFDLIEETITGKAEKRAVGDGLSDDRTTQTVLETWKWTGKFWRQISELKREER